MLCGLFSRLLTAPFCRGALVVKQKLEKIVKMEESNQTSKQSPKVAGREIGSEKEQKIPEKRNAGMNFH